MQARFLIILITIFLVIPNAFARSSSCLENRLPLFFPDAKMLTDTADVLACKTTRQEYQCAKLEEDLDLSEKAQIIKCDTQSLTENSLSKTSSDCLWNGLKISLDNLSDLGTQIAKGFNDTQLCNQSIDKKREILGAFSKTMEDPRFRLSEQEVGRWLEEATCSEIEQRLSARVENYRNTFTRERTAMINSGKVVSELKAEQRPAGTSLLKLLKSTINSSIVSYQCYTPKVKAEMLCAGLTSLLVDTAMGGGVAMAAKRMIAVIKSKRALGRIEKALSNGQKAELSDSARLLKSDRLKAAELVLERGLSEIEEKAIIKAHNVGSGRGFGNYTKKDIDEKARELKKAETIKVDERRALMENGITGTEGLDLKYGETFRVKNQGILSEAFERGAREKVQESLAETRKYYKELSNLSDTNFNKVFTPDSNGVANVKWANEFGLSASESANVLERILRLNNLDFSSNFRSAISSVSDSIKEYSAMSAKKYSTALGYKIYRAKELRAELLERYYTNKYPDKYKELDYDKMNPKEQEILSAIRKDLEESRALAEKNRWPR